MSGVIDKYWIKTTCQVVSEEGKGTGFLFGIKEKKKIFFVTNKHVISKVKEKRVVTDKIHLLINSDDENSTLKKDEIQINFDKSNWREHPDDDVDVFVVDITGAIIQLRKQYSESLYAQAILDSYVADENKIRELDIKITDEVFIIGYPLTDKLQHHRNNYPFVTQGIIASRIGEPLEDGQGKKDRRHRVLRGFLIHGGILPGSSGSPVVLKPTHYREIGNEIRYETFPPLLLGIASETRFVFTDTFYTQNFYSLANLGIAFDAITIIETIKLFGQNGKSQ